MADNSAKKLLQLLGGRLKLEYDRYPYQLRNLSRQQQFNFLLSRLEARLNAASPLSYPIALQLEPTIQCQLDCPLCPRVRATKEQTIGHMPWESYEKLMREIGPSLLAISFWQWGESLLQPRIADMVRLAKSYGIMTMISTNGQHDGYLDNLNELFAAGLDLLIISMDGASQEVYHQFRQGGDVDTVRRFTAAAVQAKKQLALDTPLINVRIIATRENEHEIDLVRQFSRDSGVDMFSVKSVSLYYDPDPENPHLPLNKDFRSYQYRGTEEAAAYQSLPNTCVKPWSWPTLRYDGTLLFCECDHDSSQVLGNVFTSSFRDVWRGQQAREMRRAFHPGGQSGLSFCQRCRYKMNDAIREITLFDR